MVEQMSLIGEVIIDLIAGSEPRVVNYVTIQAAWVKQIKLLFLHLIVLEMH